MARTMNPGVSTPVRPASPIVTPGVSARGGLFGLTVVFSFFMNYVIVSFVLPALGYRNVSIGNVDPWVLFFTYFCALAPLVAYRLGRCAATMSGAAIIYAVSYVPMQLTMPLIWEREESYLMVLQAVLAFGMVGIFWASATTLGIQDRKKLTIASGPVREFTVLITVLSVLTTLLIFVGYGGSLRFVALSQAHDLRLDNEVLDVPTFLNYLILWQTTFFVPYLVGIGLVAKSPLHLTIGAGGGIVVYMFLGSRIALVIGIFVLVVRFCYRRGGDFLTRWLLLLTPFIGFLSLIPTGRSGFLHDFKSLIFRRTIGVPGWHAVRYVEYFETHGFTYWSHFRPLNGVLYPYPYDRSLGLLVGVDTTGNPRHNMVASFWASDGIAAWGTTGVILLVPVVTAIFFIANRMASRFDDGLLALSLTGFWATLVSAPLTTALLSGGFVWLIVLWLISIRSGEHAPATR